MTNYTSLESALRLIPKNLYEHANRNDFLSYMLDAYRELNLTQQYKSNIKIYNIVNGKLILPDDIKEINLVTYLFKEPSSEDINSFTDCICNPTDTISTEEDTNNICNYTIAYKQFLDSPYYNNNFLPLQYKGNSKALLCDDCPNRNVTCQYTFVVTEDKVLYTNIDSGYICINYDTEVTGDDGLPLIPDNINLKRYLAYYAQYLHWEERAASSEQNAANMADRAIAKANLYYNKVRGLHILRGLDANTISSIQYDGYNKLLKLPEQYVYSR